MSENARLDLAKLVVELKMATREAELAIAGALRQAANDIREHPDMAIVVAYTLDKLAEELIEKKEPSCFTR